MTVSRAPATIEALPVQLGIRLALGAVSDSNALPPWIDPFVIDFDKRGRTIIEQLKKVSQGQVSLKPFGIPVPKRSGKLQVWSLPSVNEQIMLQTCVSAFAPALEASSLDARVYSYRYNRDPDLLAFVEPQLLAWSKFQSATDMRCRADECLLQIDMQDAFGSVDRARFVQFLRAKAGFSLPAQTMLSLIEDLSLTPGIPLINDSVFYLGNCYFSEVDKIIARHTGNYIRFVDDYRVFGSSMSQLEKILVDINRELAEVGMTTNISKTRLGSGQDYLDATRGTKEAKTSYNQDNYISAVELSDVPTPEVMVSLLNKAVNEPDAHLTEGMGRYLVALLRRMVTNARITRRSAYMSNPLVELGVALGEDDQFVGRYVSLLQSYAKGGQDCRAVWLLYLKHACLNELESETDQAAINKAVRDLAASSAVGPVVRHWAHGLSGGDEKERRADALHQLDYLQQGALCCGDPHA